MSILQELLTLAEGAWVIKNKDGVEKRFKTLDSPEAKAWKLSSKPPKVKVEKYSYDWWERQTGLVPWNKIEFVDNLYSSIKQQLGREPDDWTFGGHYSKEIDGIPVACRKVRLMYAYTKDDDLGLDLKDGESVEDSQMIGIRRDVKNPEKFIFDGYK